MPRRIIPAYAGSTSRSARSIPSLFRIIPAYAGSTVCEATRELSIADHPRIRGEHGSRSAPQPGPRGSSPHTRGARCARLPESYRSRIIPAYAGSTAPARRPSLGRGDHPRIRGEHEAERLRRRPRRGSSPHTRGARPPPEKRPGLARIIPAYAGSTHCPMSGAAERWDHPRIRGEHGGRSLPNL